jgi:hypothetical protein
MIVNTIYRDTTKKITPVPPSWLWVWATGEHNELQYSKTKFGLTMAGTSSAEGCCDWGAARMMEIRSGFFQSDNCN